MSRKTKRKLQQVNTKCETAKNNMSLVNIQPLTINQRRAFVQFKNKHLMLHGYAGTGKTFIALYLALKEIEYSDTFKKVVIFRSVVPARDIGFLPGSQKEKIKVYEEPYYDICRKLYERGDAYDVLKNKKMIEFYSTSFIRGITLDDAIIIVDEVQNMTSEELNSLITRVGNNCKIVLCGDIRQTDLNKRKEKSGLHDFYVIIQNMNCFELVEFGIDDIVRSALVKQYIITRTKLEDEDRINTLNAV